MQVEESYIEIDSDGDSELSSELKSDISADKSEGKTGDNTNTVLAVTISVMAEEGDCFEGADLIREFTAAGLELGKTKLYHAYADSEDGKQERTLLFTVSNILMPGIFEQSSILDLKTTGIALFFQLPREHSGKLSFESMSEIAYQLSRGLGGVVCDGARRELKPYALQRLRDQVYEFEYNQELERRRAEISD
jgi:cell division protein ZipA